MSFTLHQHVFLNRELQTLGYESATIINDALTQVKGAKMCRYKSDVNLDPQAEEANE